MALSLAQAELLSSPPTRRGRLSPDLRPTDQEAKHAMTPVIPPGPSDEQAGSGLPSSEFPHIVGGPSPAPPFAAGWSLASGITVDINAATVGTFHLTINGTNTGEIAVAGITAAKIQAAVVALGQPPAVQGALGQPNQPTLPGADKALVVGSGPWTILLPGVELDTATGTATGMDQALAVALLSATVGGVPSTEFENLRFWVDQDANVHLEGVANFAKAAAAAVFQLPPPGTVSETPGSGYQFAASPPPFNYAPAERVVDGNVQVDPEGNVSWNGDTSAAAGAAEFQVSYRAAGT